MNLTKITAACVLIKIFAFTSVVYAFDWGSVGQVPQASEPSDSGDMVRQEEGARIEESEKEGVSAENPRLLGRPDETNSVEAATGAGVSKVEAGGSNQSRVTQVSNGSPVADAVSNQKPDLAETAAYFGVITLLLLVNFIVYVKFARLRKILISIPFYKDNASKLPESAESSKRLLEAILLCIGGVAAYFSLPEAGGPISDFLAGGLYCYFIIHIGYLLVRSIVAIQSTCHKCKTPYAVSEGSSWREPTSTFNAGYYQNSAKRQVPKIFEVGVEYTDKSCAVCGNTWTTKKGYKKRLFTADSF